MKYTFRGVHCWKECPLENVQFLRDEHHHEFEVILEMSVNDSDREFEFIKTQQLLQSIIHNLYPNYNENKNTDIYLAAIKTIFPDNTYIPYTAYLGSRSCQMIAEEIIDCFKKVCPNNITISISEDGHYGGKVEYINKKEE